MALLARKKTARIQERLTGEEAFKMLGWADLETQRNAHKCILLFKCLNDLVPPYVSDYFITNRSIHTYKTRHPPTAP